MMRFIPQNNKAIFPIVTVLFILLCFMAGCKETPPAKPTVVSKRIEKAPEKVSSEKKAASPVKETVPPSTPAATPDAKKATQKGSVKAEKQAPVPTDSPTVAEKEAQEETEQQEGGQPENASELQSLRSSLPDDSPLYNPAGKIDPFMPLFREDRRGASDTEETKPKRPLTPLEQIDLSQLKLVAVLQTQKGNKAMVEDSTGKGYVLTPGIFIGINSGKVTKILKDSVIVEEETKDFLGKLTTNTRELKLQKPFGEE